MKPSAAQTVVHGQNVVFGNQNVNGGVHYHQSEPSEDRRRHDRQKEFLRALYTCPYSDRKNRNDRRVPGTCEWFTNHAYFRNWRESDKSSLLWISADPGCGKSVLTRYLVDDVLLSTTDSITCYFFFKDDFADQKSSANAISAILRQIFLANPQLLSNQILDKFDMDGDEFLKSFDEQWRLLLDIATNKYDGEIVCLLDALDECQDRDRLKLIRAVGDFYRQNMGRLRLKFLLTSRPYKHIWREFRGLEKRVPTIHLSGDGETEAEKISEEIDLVIAHRVKSLCDEKNLTMEEHTFLLKQLRLVRNRTYLWVTLILDVIQGVPGFTSGNAQRLITKIPETVEAAYNAILNRSSDANKAKLLLHIVTAATRPLSIVEVSWALAAGETQGSYNDIRKYIEPEDRFRVTVRQLCGLFVTIIDNKIYLLHQSAKEFLVQRETLIPPEARLSTAQEWPVSWKLSLRPCDSHRILANICLCYVLQKLHIGPLKSMWDYSVENWPIHFRKADVQKEDPIVEVALGFCEQQSKPNLQPMDESSFSIPRHTSSLAIASRLGLEAVVKRFLELKEVDLNEKDRYGDPPLVCAANMGYAEIVKLLLDTGKVNLDSRGNGDRTALFYAADRGHAEIVKLLLETGKVNPNFKDEYDYAPLSYVVKDENAEIVKLLLDAGNIDANPRDPNGNTPLLYAVRGEDVEMVKLLLDSGKVNPNPRSEYGDTPITLAAGKGNAEIIKLLLDTGKVDPNTKNGYGGFCSTPLSIAAKAGHEGVVRLLLESAKVNPKNKLDKKYLPYFVAKGYARAVAKLLPPAVEVDSKDDFQRTPLLLATDNGHKKIVQLLLQAGASPHSEDKHGETPLFWARKRGEAMLQVFTEYDEAIH